MEIKLSILIATMPVRRLRFVALTGMLKNQCLGLPVEIISDSSMLYNIGTKRNNLLKSAKGEYITFVDDDDLISPAYVEKILAACEKGADCIGISGCITFNGGNLKKWHISKEYGRWYEKDNVYYRTPNHISPVRRELALKAGFPEIAFGEDAEYSKRLLPMLKTETIIEGNLYHYKYEPKKVYR